METKGATEGSLIIDVWETKNAFVLQSTIAGIRAEDLDIAIDKDIISIRGSRQQQEKESLPTEGDKKYFYQECYWGAFSRQLILPEQVDGSKAKAVVKDGILTLTIPKLEKKRRGKVVIRQEE